MVDEIDAPLADSPGAPRAESAVDGGQCLRRRDVARIHVARLDLLQVPLARLAVVRRVLPLLAPTTILLYFLKIIPKAKLP